MKLNGMMKKERKKENKAPKSREPDSSSRQGTKMKRRLTATEEAQDTRSRLRGTTGGGKPDVNPAYKKGGMMKKKGMAKGGKVRGSGIARQGVRAARMV
tara:strand:- start:369 stop:665 length:297 start_codon:yes stop_codon:yes gene_type:complete